MRTLACVHNEEVRGVIIPWIHSCYPTHIVQKWILHMHYNYVQVPPCIL